MSDEQPVIAACPQCDRADLRQKQRSVNQPPRSDDADWYCVECGAHVDEPNWRPRKKPGTYGRHSPTVRALQDADPDIDLRGGDA